MKLRIRVNVYIFLLFYYIMCDLEQYHKDGYIICEDVFTPDELDACANEITTYCKENPYKLFNAAGISIPDFLGRHNLPLTHKLKDSIKLHQILETIFCGSENYRFCSHNDIGINRIVGWHKDKLNGDVEKYQVHNIWEPYEGEKHEIVKVLTYLEDHCNDNDGLKVVPRSHTIPEINSLGAIQLRPKKGSVIIFDQRITHRGMENQCNYSRILVSMGFGKNNIFTDEFEHGTIVRQNMQNGVK